MTYFSAAFIEDTLHREHCVGSQDYPEKENEPLRTRLFIVRVLLEE